MTLTAPQIRFLQRLTNEEPPQNKASQVAEFFSEHFHIGIRVGRTFEYLASDHLKAAQMLASSGLPLEPLTVGALRSEASGFPGMSEKIGTRKPHSDSVAVKPVAGTCSLNDQQLTVPPGSYLVLSCEQALSIRAGRLLVVENFETFRYLERYDWISYHEQDVLAVFRGDPQYRTDVAQEVIRQRSEPVWAFCDFDPAGLAICANLPRLERIVLPGFDDLEETTLRARRQDLYMAQLPQYGNLLDSDSRDLVANVWNLMKRLRTGLPQEWM